MFCRRTCSMSVLPWLLLFTMTAISWWQNAQCWKSTQLLTNQPKYKYFRPPYTLHASLTESEPDLVRLLCLSCRSCAFSPDICGVFIKQMHQTADAVCILFAWVFAGCVSPYCSIYPFDGSNNRWRHIDRWIMCSVCKGQFYYMGHFTVSETSP